MTQLASDAVALPGGAIAFVGKSFQVEIKPGLKPGLQGATLIDPSPAYVISKMEDDQGRGGVIDSSPPNFVSTARLSEFNRLMERPGLWNWGSLDNGVGDPEKDDSIPDVLYSTAEASTSTASGQAVQLYAAATCGHHTYPAACFRR